MDGVIDGSQYGVVVGISVHVGQCLAGGTVEGIVQLLGGRLGELVGRRQYDAAGARAATVEGGWVCWWACLVRSCSVVCLVFFTAGHVGRVVGGSAMFGRYWGRF